MNIVNMKEFVPTFLENYTDEEVSQDVYQNYNKKIINYKK
jgi:hypothetical protein